MIHIVIVLASLISTAYAGIGFPSVVELEAALSLRHGVEFKIVPTMNGPLHAYYLGASSHGDGRYSVEVLLRR